jgi:ferredoxin-type protein NapH
MASPVETISAHAQRVVASKRLTKKFWARARLITSLTALALVALTAALKVELGTFSSLALGPIQFACPLGVAQVIAASQQFIPAFALAGLIGLLSIVLLGRVFCGWLCPGRWMLNRGPWQAKSPFKYRGWIQGALAGGVVGLAAVCHTPVFCIVCPAGVVCRGAIAAGAGGSLVPTLGWLGGIISFEWLSRRSWCRDLCPLGGAISLVSRFNPFLKFKSNPEKCRPCKACENACPEGMNIGRAVDTSVCMKCFACQAVCPRDAVEIQPVAFKITTTKSAH